MVKMVDLKDIAGVGSIFIIYDQGGIHRHSLTAAVHAVQEHHVGSLVHMGIDEAHSLGLKAARAELCDQLCQSQGAVDQVKMASGTEQCRRRSDDILKRAENLMAGDGPGIDPACTGSLIRRGIPF